MSEAKVNVGVKSGAVAAGLSSIKNQFRSFRSEISGSFAGLFAFSAVTAGLHQAVAKASELVDVSSRFGVSAEDLQMVANAGKANGATLTDVAAAWNKLTINQNKALRGDEALRQEFDALGVSLRDLETLSTQELFSKISDATMTASDRGAAYSSVVALMGKSSGALYTTLELGSAAMRKASEDIGIMSATTAEALDTIGDDLGKLSNQLTLGLGGAVVWTAKAWSTAVSEMTTNARVFGSMATGIFSSAWRAAAGDAEGAKRAWKTMLDEAKAYDQAGNEAYNEIWNPPESNKPKGKAPVDAEETEKAKSTAAEKVRLEESLQELKQRGLMAQLEGEAKIAELMRQQASILEKADNAKTDQERLRMLTKAEEISQEIAREQKQSSDEEARYHEKLARLSQEAADAGSDKPRLEELEKRRALLGEEIKAATDLKTIREKGLQAAELDKDIAAERKKKREGQEKEKEDQERLRLQKEKEAPRVAADRLQTIGGGGRAAGSGIDQQLREARTQSALLRKVVGALSANQPLILRLK